MNPKHVPGGVATTWRRAAWLACALLVGACTALAPNDDELRGTRSATDGGAGSSALDASGSDSGSDAALDDATPPAAIPKTNLLLWLMADRGVEHSASAVTRWLDQSGNGLHATQPTTDQHPHLWPTGINGMPALDFDGSQDFLVLPDGFADFSRGVTLFALVQTGTLESCASLVELSNGEEIDDIAFGRVDASPACEVADSDLHQSDLKMPVNTPLLTSATVSPYGEARTYLNGVYAAAQSEFALPANKLRRDNFIGRSLYSACHLWLGKIGEVIVYNRYLDDTERSAVEGYLQKKWKCCG